jgi:GntR family transcriptional regulator/MocR family aminotransferase
MVKLTIVPVIPLALSEAMKTATLAISASVISRRACRCGGFAHHIRKVGRVYSARHAMITQSLATDFNGRLQVVPSAVGLHVTALVRGTSAGELSAVVRRASRAGVEVQDLARYTNDVPRRHGLVVGYGAIATSRIQEGLDRLRSCLDEAVH